MKNTMGFFAKLRRLRPAVLTGVEAQSRLIDERFRAVIAGMDNQSRLLNDKFGELIAAVNTQSRVVHSMETQARAVRMIISLRCSMLFARVPQVQNRRQRCWTAFCAMQRGAIITGYFGVIACSPRINRPDFVMIRHFKRH
jgi:hypothetical protein